MNLEVNKMRNNNFCSLLCLTFSYSCPHASMIWEIMWPVCIR